MPVNQSKFPSLLLLATVGAIAVAGCGGKSAPEPAATSAPESAAPAASAEAPAVPDAAAELEAREKELAAREVELQLKERELDLARREAELATKQNAPKAASPARIASSTAKPATSTASAASTSKPKAPPTPINVAAGTQLSAELTSSLTTKTAKVGDRFQARLASDVVVDGRRAAAAGSAVQGSVTEVISGSSKIGGTPMLALAFDGLTLASGATVPISGRFVQQGKSETGKDTAKIVGGAAAGAVIGHQIDHDKSSVIGGILGGAAGVAAAKKTGGEVELPAGTVVTFALGKPFEVSGN
jgi:hypothetical protein